MVGSAELCPWAPLTKWVTLSHPVEPLWAQLGCSRAQAEYINLYAHDCIQQMHPKNREICRSRSLPAPRLQPLPLPQHRSGFPSFRPLEIRGSCLRRQYTHSKNEDHLCNQTVNFLENVGMTPQGRAVIMEGPEEAAERDLDHSGAELHPLEKEKERLQVTNGGEPERTWLPFTHLCSHIEDDRGCHTRLPVKRMVWSAHFPISIIIQKNGSLVEIGHFLGKKNTAAGCA